MFVLASGSPRRIDILKANNYTFIVEVSQIKEDIDMNLNPSTNATKIALAKAFDVQKRHRDKIIVAADTIVVLNNEILGKPKDRDDAFLMLKKLSNQTHEVITGVAIIHGKKEITFYDKSLVTFKNLTDQEIIAYINTKEPFGKAGSYAIQGLGKALIKDYKGDYYNIMGFPIIMFNSKIKEF